MDKVLVNGKQQSTISVSDRSLAYGDGLFTTAKVVKGKVEFYSSHIARLMEGCDFLDIELDCENLEKEIKVLVENVHLAVLKIVVTAGSGGRGYSRIGVNNSQRIISLHRFPEHYNDWAQQGISMGDSTLCLGLNPLLRGVKHLNRLEQVLIRKEVDISSYDDLLVTDINGMTVETSSANVFWFEGEHVFTPDISKSGVNGVYRQQLLDFDNKIRLVQVEPSQLSSVSALFLCNSVMGIVPVSQYNGRKLCVDAVVKYRNNFLKSLSVNRQ